MNRRLLLLPGILALLLFVLFPYAAQAAAPPPAAKTLGAQAPTRVRLMASVAQIPSAATPSPGSDCSSDPKTCAQNLTAPLDGLGQAAIASFQKVLLWIGILVVVILAVKGLVNLATGQPHGLAFVIASLVGVAFLLAVGFGAPAFVTAIHNGPIQLVPTPAIK